jgi:sensor histidine kinase regulating citrate/malate metabolism
MLSTQLWGGLACGHQWVTNFMFTDEWSECRISHPKSSRSGDPMVGRHTWSATTTGMRLSCFLGRMHQ